MLDEDTIVAKCIVLVAGAFYSLVAVGSPVLSDWQQVSMILLGAVCGAAVSVTVDHFWTKRGREMSKKEIGARLLVDIGVAIAICPAVLIVSANRYNQGQLFPLEFTLFVSSGISFSGWFLAKAFKTFGPKVINRIGKNIVKNGGNK